MREEDREAADPAERLRDALDLLAGLLAVGLIILVYADRSGLPRVLLALGFAFFVPGRAIVSNWPGVGRWSEGTMSMILSLAVLTLVAMVTLWAHFWHPLGLFGAEAWLSLIALAVGAVRRHRRRPGSDDPQAGYERTLHDGAWGRLGRSARPRR